MHVVVNALQLTDHARSFFRKTILDGGLVGFFGYFFRRSRNFGRSEEDCLFEALRYIFAILFAERHASFESHDQTAYRHRNFTLRTAIKRLQFSRRVFAAFLHEAHDVLLEALLVVEVIVVSKRTAQMCFKFGRFHFLSNLRVPHRLGAHVFLVEDQRVGFALGASFNCFSVNFHSSSFY